MDVIVLDQTMEHLVKPRKAIKEARRVLTKDGLLCISVPDASRYNRKYFFDFFWFLIREHIQHFDVEHLKLLASKEGFELVDYRQYDTPMMSEKMILPVLTAIFRLTGREKFKIHRACFSLKKQITDYITKNAKRLGKKQKIIADFIKSQKPVYVWGIGREFLYLYESAGLKNCNIAGLVDISPYKRGAYKIGGRRILSESILKKAKSDSALLICAVAHTKPIIAAALKIGYRGQIITL